MNTITSTVKVKRLEISDAERYLELLHRLDSEVDYMHYKAGERTMTVHGMRSRICKMQKQGNQFVMVAYNLSDEMIGYFSVNGGNSSSSAHSSTVAVGVVGEYRRMSVARELFIATVQEALTCGIIRMECTVVAFNTPAVNYYLRMGFDCIALLHYRFYDGREYLPEYVMERLFI